MNLSLRLGYGVFKIDGDLLALDVADGDPNMPGGTIDFSTRPTEQKRMLVNNNENLNHDEPYADRTEAVIYSGITY